MDDNCYKNSDLVALQWIHGNVVGVNQMIGIMMGSIAVFGIIYYVVTLLPDGEGGR